MVWLAARAVDEINCRVRALDRRDDDVSHQPRLESRTLTVPKKAYFWCGEPRRKPRELLEAVEKWWAWRQSPKPPARVFGV